MKMIKIASVETSKKKILENLRGEVTLEHLKELLKKLVYLENFKRGGNS